MNIDLYQPFFASLPNHNNCAWQTTLHNTLVDIFANPPHGDFAKWKNAVDDIPKNHTSHCKFNQSIIEVGNKQELDKQQLEKLVTNLHTLLPWRKGPFNLFGTLIDA